jgi:hypothetical protein
MPQNRTMKRMMLLLFVLFPTIAMIQYLFIRHEIRQTFAEKLSYWADDLRSILDRNDTLDLPALRHSAPKASAFVILASDGTVIATHGFVRGSISYAALPPVSDYDQPIVLKSSLGEQWHLFAKRLKGGSVVVGAPSSISPPDINARLVDSAKGFGSSLESAMGATFRERDAHIDFALLADDGILWDDDGGIPLRVKKAALLNKAEGSIVTIAGTPFFISKIPILDRAKKQTGTIVVMKDVTLEEILLREALIFNIVVALVALILCGLVALTGHNEEAPRQSAGKPGTMKAG